MLRDATRIVATLNLVMPAELCGGQNEEPAVTGTVTYLQRSTLPPDVVLNVQLQDVSLRDAPANMVAEVKIVTEGKQVPIPFRIPHNPADINPVRSYAVRATITAGGKIMFTSTAAYPAITHGAPTEVSIIVQPAGARTAAKPLDKSVAMYSKQAVTFAGDFPCAECSGKRLTLTLRPDGTFRSRLTYRGAAAGKDESFYDIGRWTLEKDGTRLVLRGGKEAPEQFAVRDTDTLHQLNDEGKEIGSHQDYDLKRPAEVNSIGDTYRVTGEFICLADARILTECLTGATFPVAQEKDSIALEQAYASSGVAGGQPLLVTFSGHFRSRSRMEASGALEVIVVDKLDRVRPKEKCQPPAGKVSPANPHSPRKSR